MYCQKCGQQNQDTATLCVKCGAQLGVATSVAAATPMAPAASNMYAGFWKRFAAFIIDYLIVVVLAMVTGGIIGLIYGVASGTAGGAEGFGALAGLAVWWVYHAVMESSQKQATLGKMALGIKVTDQNGARLSFGRATGRHFAKILSSMILAIGYFMAGFTAKRQALHDMIAGCLVVNGNATEAQIQTRVPAAAMPGWAIALIVVAAMVVPLGIFAAIAIPAYQDFTMRARIAEAMAVVGTARLAVRDYYEQNQKLPNDLPEAFKAAGVTAQVSPHVRSLTFEPRTGEIRVVLAQSSLDGKSILFAPQIENKTINWKCRSDDVPRRYLPHSCREETAGK